MKGGRPNVVKRRSEYNRSQRPMYMERFRFERYIHVKWTAADEQLLLELVARQREAGKAIDYEALSAQLGRRYPWSIHNKLL